MRLPKGSRAHVLLVICLLGMAYVGISIAFVERYGGELIIERLYPFLMLVVGFFPSTFSLVIGLETFVGEKERRSLEPLLTTPLTDFQLYLGKLLASTAPPVLASYLGQSDLDDHRYEGRQAAVRHRSRS